jgi:hypothetical protein
MFGGKNLGFLTLLLHTSCKISAQNYARGNSFNFGHAEPVSPLPYSACIEVYINNCGEEIYE